MVKVTERQSLREFVVDLSGLNLRGANIPRIGTVLAHTPTQAVTSYLIRETPQKGRLVAHNLSNSGRRLGDYAYELTFATICDESVSQTKRDLTPSEKVRCAPYLLALEIAASQNRPPVEGDLIRADYLLKVVYKAKVAA